MTPIDPAEYRARLARPASKAEIAEAAAHTKALLRQIRRGQDPADDLIRRLAAYDLHGIRHPFGDRASLINAAATREARRKARGAEAEAWWAQHPELSERSNRRWGSWDSTPASGTKGRPRHEDAGREPSGKKSRRRADVVAELTSTDAMHRRWADIADARAVAGLMPVEIQERIELEQVERFDAADLRHLGLAETVDPHAGTLFGRLYQAGALDDAQFEAGERLHELHHLLFNGYPRAAAGYDILRLGTRIDCGHRVGTCSDDGERDVVGDDGGDPIDLDEAPLEIRKGEEPEIEIATPDNHYDPFGDDLELRERARERLNTVENFVVCACGDGTWELLRAAYAADVAPSDNTAVVQLILALSMAFVALSDPAPITRQAMQEFREWAARESERADRDHGPYWRSGRVSTEMTPSEIRLIYGGEIRYSAFASPEPIEAPDPAAVDDAQTPAQSTDQTLLAAD